MLNDTDPTGGSTWTDEHYARMFLITLTEGGNAPLVQWVSQRGAVRVAHDVLAGAITHPVLRPLVARVPQPASNLHESIEDQLVRAQQLSARFIIPGDAQWPTQLDDLGSRAPLGLWVLGHANLRLLALRSVAMVGARAATSYGQALARTTAGTLADRGWLVISGGAFGIDASAHQGALGAGGATVCVLASGVDVPYPRSHEQLLGAIVRDGLLVSEAPLGACAQRQRFLTRNRIIAALSRATIVVEAALRSGSRTTAREADDLLRLVMAFPGPVTSVASAGCHELIKDNAAILVTDADDIVNLLGPAPPMFDIDGLVDDPDDDAKSDPISTAVLGALGSRSASSVADLVAVTQLSTEVVVSTLGVMELTGLVKRSPSGWQLAAASLAAHDEKEPAP